MAGKAAVSVRFLSLFMLHRLQLVQTVRYIPVSKVDHGEGGEVFLGRIDVLEAHGQHPRPVEGPLAEIDIAVGQGNDGRLVALESELILLDFLEALTDLQGHGPFATVVLDHRLKFLDGTVVIAVRLEPEGQFVPPGHVFGIPV